jgi:hypothetical protein
MYLYRAIDGNGNTVEFCLSERRKALQRRGRPERIVIDGSQTNREAILCGIEMIHMMRQGQATYACRSQLSLAEQFHLLAPWAHDEAPAPSSSLLRVCNRTILSSRGSLVRE